MWFDFQQKRKNFLVNSISPESMLTRVYFPDDKNVTSKYNSLLMGIYWKIYVVWFFLTIQRLKSNQEQFLTEQAILQYFGLIKNNIVVIESEKHKGTRREQKLFYQVLHALITYLVVRLSLCWPDIRILLRRGKGGTIRSALILREPSDATNLLVALGLSENGEHTISIVVVFLSNSGRHWFRISCRT